MNMPILKGSYADPSKKKTETNQQANTTNTVPTNTSNALPQGMPILKGSYADPTVQPLPADKETQAAIEGKLPTSVNVSNIELATGPVTSNGKEVAEEAGQGAILQNDTGINAKLKSFYDRSQETGGQSSPGSFNAIDVNALNPQELDTTAKQTILAHNTKGYGNLMQTLSGPYNEDKINEAASNVGRELAQQQVSQSVNQMLNAPKPTLMPSGQARQNLIQSLNTLDEGKINEAAIQYQSSLASENKQAKQAQQEAALNQRVEGYRQLTNAPDYKDKSRYVSTYQAGKTTNKNEIKYNYINGNKEAIDYIDNGPFKDIRYLKNMNATEKGMYNYLYKTQGANAAEQFLTDIQSDLYERNRQKTEKYWTEIAEKYPLEASVFSVAAKPLEAMTTPQQVIDYLRDGRIDQNAPYNTGVHAISAVRSDVAKKIENILGEKWGPKGSFLYNIGMSMADSVVNMAPAGLMGKLGEAKEAVEIAEKIMLGVMGSGAAADTIVAKKDQGLDENRAIALGLIAGFNEYITERIGMDSMMEILTKDVSEKTFKQYVFKSLLQQTGAEGLEEGLSDVLNWSADLLYAAATDSPSEFEDMIRAYMKDGKSSSEALSLAVMDRMSELGLDVLGGALSGFFMGAGGSLINYGGEILSRVNTIEKSKSAQEALVEEGLKSDHNTSAYEAAKRNQKTLDEGDSLGTIQILHQMSANEQAIRGEEAVNQNNRWQNLQELDVASRQEAPTLKPQTATKPRVELLTGIKSNDPQFADKVQHKVDITEKNISGINADNLSANDKVKLKASRARLQAIAESELVPAPTRVKANQLIQQIDTTLSFDGTTPVQQAPVSTPVNTPVNTPTEPATIENTPKVEGFQGRKQGDIRTVHRNYVPAGSELETIIKTAPIDNYDTVGVYEDGAMKGTIVLTQYDDFNGSANPTVVNTVLGRQQNDGSYKWVKVDNYNGSVLTDKHNLVDTDYQGFNKNEAQQSEKDWKALASQYNVSYDPEAITTKEGFAEFQKRLNDRMAADERNLDRYASDIQSGHPMENWFRVATDRELYEPYKGNAIGYIKAMNGWYSSGLLGDNYNTKLEQDPFYSFQFKFDENLGRNKTLPLKEKARHAAWEAGKADRNLLLEQAKTDDFPIHITGKESSDDVIHRILPTKTFYAGNSKNIDADGTYDDKNYAPLVLADVAAEGDNLIIRIREMPATSSGREIFLEVPNYRDKTSDEIISYVNETYGENAFGEHFNKGIQDTYLALGLEKASRGHKSGQTRVRPTSTSDNTTTKTESKAKGKTVVTPTEETNTPTEEAEPVGVSDENNIDESSVLDEIIGNENDLGRAKKSKKDFLRDIVNLFNIKSGSRNDIKAKLHDYADSVILNGYGSEADRQAILDTLYDTGEATIEPEGTAQDIASYFKGRKIYVSDNIKKEFDDAWKNIQKSLFSNKVFITNNSNDVPLDAIIQEANGIFGNILDEYDPRGALEAIQGFMEDGKPRTVSLREAGQHEASMYGDRAGADYFDRLERGFDEAVRRFAEKAELEISLTPGENESKTTKKSETKSTPKQGETQTATEQTEQTAEPEPVEVPATDAHAVMEELRKNKTVDYDGQRYRVKVITFGKEGYYSVVADLESGKEVYNNGPFRSEGRAIADLMTALRTKLLDGALPESPNKTDIVDSTIKKTETSTPKTETNETEDAKIESPEEENLTPYQQKVKDALETHDRAEIDGVLYRLETMEEAFPAINAESTKEYVESHGGIFVPRNEVRGFYRVTANDVNGVEDARAVHGFTDFYDTREEAVRELVDIAKQLAPKESNAEQEGVNENGNDETSERLPEIPESEAVQKPAERGNTPADNNRTDYEDTGEGRRADGTERQTDNGKPRVSDDESERQGRRDTVGESPSNRAGESGTGSRDLGYVIETDPMEGATPVKRYDANIAAIKLLKQIQESGREYATPEEREVLAQYTGWGGLKDTFVTDGKNKAWTKRGEELKDLLGDKAFKEASASSMSAFYTPKSVVDSVYKIIEQLGFSKGTILEPSCGTGIFIGSMPQNLRRNSIYAVELDSTSGTIAKLLYPNAQVNIGGFEDFAAASNSIDMIVGNVPFGDFKVYDSNYKQYSKENIHNFFMLKCADLLKPNGVMALLTSTSTMDSSVGVLEELKKKVELVDAFRLPSGTFGNTDVVSDLLIFQKKGSEPYAVSKVFDRIGQYEGVNINDYFLQNPDRVLGTLELTTNQYGQNTLTVKPNGRSINDLMDQLPTDIMAVGKQINTNDEAMAVHQNNLPENMDPATLQPGTIFKKDGQLMRINEDNELEPAYRDVFKTEDVIDPETGEVAMVATTGKFGEVTLKKQRENKHEKIYIDPKSKDYQRLNALVGIADAYQEYLDAMLTTNDNAVIEPARKKFNMLYDAFAKQFTATTNKKKRPGAINDAKNKQVFGSDPRYWQLAATEASYSLDGATYYKKGDVFFKRTLNMQKTIQNVDNANDALFASINVNGTIDFDYMEKLYGKNKDEMLAELYGNVFEDPANPGTYLTATQYLSGPVREKLAEAKRLNTSGQYDSNIKALEAAIPKDIEATDISVNLGASWVGEDTMKEFVYELTQDPSREPTVTYLPYNALWTIRMPITSSLRNWGTSRMSAEDILNKTMNHQNIEIKDRDQWGTEYTNREETDKALAKADEMNEFFKDWIFRDPARRARLQKRYNEIYNDSVVRKYDGSFLLMPGMALAKLYDHQKNAIYRMLSERSTLLVHPAGSGKTFAMLGAAHEMKRLGLANKPLFVVPNHKLEDFMTDYYRMYPQGKVLAVRNEDWTKQRRQNMIRQIQTMDPDIIIIRHSSFESFGFSKEFEEQYKQRRIDELRAAIEAAKEGKMDKRAISAMEKRLRNYEMELKMLLDRATDDIIPFDQTGIDALFVDEAHNFKNLENPTRMSRIPGAFTGDSKKATRMHMAAEFMEEHGNKVVFATATPVSNTMGEIYNMFRYLRPDLLSKIQIPSYDAFASAFGEIVTASEPNTTGTGVVIKQRFAKFNNIPELVSAFRLFADVLKESELRLDKPKRVDRHITAESSEVLDKFNQFIEYRKQQIKGQKFEKGEDTPLTLYGDAKMAALDLRMVYNLMRRQGLVPWYSNINDFDLPNSKINKVVDTIWEEYNNSTDIKGTQVVFLDRGVPAAKLSKEKQAHIQKLLDKARRLEQIANGEATGEDIEPLTEREQEELQQIQDERRYGFDLYADIKTKLMARGIPESEIAFIQDTQGGNTEKKKQDLFDKVRRGDVRVLLGSTAMMGEGMNVQDKAVAIHNVNAPDRPSDITQRNARVWRQGNVNKEVRVYYYSTLNSFDAAIWNTLDRKNTFIESVIAGDADVRSMEDLGDTGFENMSIEAANNPLVFERSDLLAEIKRLESQKKNAQEAQYNAQDTINKYQTQKSEAEQKLAYFEKVKDVIDKNTDTSIKIGNEVFDTAQKASVAVMEWAKDKLNGKNHNETTWYKIGTMRGLPIEIRQNDMFGRFKVRLAENNQFQVSADLTISDGGKIRDDDPNVSKFNTVMQRLANTLRMDGKNACLGAFLNDTKNTLSRLDSQYKVAQETVNKTFDKEPELAAKKARLKEVEGQLGDIGKQTVENPFAQGFDVMESLQNEREKATRPAENEEPISYSKATSTTQDQPSNYVVLKEETIDKYLKDYATKFTPNYAQAFITYMSPDDFLKLTTSGQASRMRIESQTGELDLDELKDATIYQPFQLQMDTKTGRIEGHEGRHRATALSRAGVTQIPVLIFDSRNKYDKEHIASIVLKGQNFNGKYNRARVTAENLIPFNYANRDEIIERFTQRPAEQSEESTISYAKNTVSNSRWDAERVGDTDVTVKPLSEIVADIQNWFDVNITTGHISMRDALGTYDKRYQGIRTRSANDLPTLLHELGHKLDDEYDLVGGMSDAIKEELVNNLDPEFKTRYSKKALPGEGIAEYLRYYMQNSAFASKKYPRFTKYLMEKMSYEAYAQLQTLADEANAYYALGGETATDTVRLKEEGTPDDRTWKKKIKDTFNNIKQDVITDNWGIHLFDEATGSNVEMIADNSAYTDAIIGQTITGAQLWINAEYKGPGLKTCLEGVNLEDKEEYRLFGELYKVVHGIERYKEGLQTFADPRKDNAEWMEKRRDEILAEHPGWMDNIDMLTEFTRTIRDAWLVDTGLLDKQTVDDWDKRYEHYVPFYRVLTKHGKGGGPNVADGYVNQTAPVYKAVGSGLDTWHPVDNIIDFTIKAIKAGSLNRVGVALVEAAQETNANAKLLETIPTPMTVTAVSTERLKKAAQNQLETEIENGNVISNLDVDVMQGIIENMDDVIYRYSPANPHGDIICVMVNGNRRYYKVNDPLLLKSLLRLNHKKAEGILGFYGKFSRFMTSNITGNNLVWSIFSNAPRDFMTLLTYAHTRNVATLVQGITSAYKNMAKGDNADPLFMEYLSMGGGNQSVYSVEQDVVKNARRKLFGKNASLNPLDYIGFVADVIEMGPRFAEYSYCRSIGMTPEEAIWAAHDVTVNFARGGKISREINKVIPFFNASVQGADKMFRYFTAEDIKGDYAERRNVATTRFLGWVAASAILAMLTMLANYRDDDTEKEYEQLSNYTKNAYFNIPLGDGMFFAIPKPRELGVLTSFFESVVEYFYGKNQHAFDEFYSYVVDNALPGGASDLAQGDWQGALGSFGVFGLGAYMMANRDFLGKPIVSSSLEKLEPELQYDRRTSKAALLIGQTLKTSPKMVDYFLQNTLGGFWKYQKAWFPVGEEYSDWTAGVKNSYFKDNQYSTDLVNWLYDQAAASDTKARSYKSIDNSITAKMDSNMTTFYGRYYNLAKNKTESDRLRATRQTVLDMIYEYRKASDNETTTAAQKAVYKACKAANDTAGLPAVMNTEVEDSNGKKHQLNDYEYVKYQTYYLDAYYSMVNSTFKSVASNADKAKLLKHIKEVAKASADDYILKNKKASSGYFDKFAGLNDSQVAQWKYLMDLTNDDDNSTTQNEVVEAIRSMNLSGEQSYTLFHSKYKSDKNNPWRAYAH